MDDDGGYSHITLGSLEQGIGTIVVVLVVAMIVGVPMLKLGDFVFGGIGRFRRWLAWRDLERHYAGKSPTLRIPLVILAFLGVVAAALKCNLG